MKNSKQLYLSYALVKAAARGELALGLLQTTPKHMLEKATNPRAASELSQFARLPNPLAKPPMFPLGSVNQLQSDWQPAFTRTAPPKLPSFLLTGHPEATGAEWANQHKRDSLARIIKSLRQQRLAPQSPV